MAAKSTWTPPDRFDEFRVLRPLGAGTMGQVFLGHDTLLDRPVAIKFIAAVEPDEAARQRFLVEARAVARLAHPNVVTLYRVGEVARRPYLVSELVHGRSLALFDRPLPWERVLSIGLGLARGLAAAHRRGVLHRDIKPANVIATDDGTVKLLDFGLAKLLAAVPVASDQTAAPVELPDSPPALDRTLSYQGAGAVQQQGAGSAALTGQGAFLGTPLYMAPEQWRGEAATAASDVYALGALLYELCSGRPPHEGKTLPELAQAVREGTPRPLLAASPGTGAWFAEVVDRCLRPDPKERFASAEALCQALEANPSPPQGRRRWRLGAALALAVLLGAGSYAMLGGVRRRGPALDSLAVLPFVNAGGDPAEDYLCDGITESLQNNVAQLPELKVIARASSFRYKGRQVDPIAAGRELGVRAVLTGRVSHHGEGLQVSVELADVRDNRLLWGERYDQRLLDVFAVQEEIARVIAERLRLTDQERGRLGRRHTADAQAYQLYLQGKQQSRPATEKGYPGPPDRRQA